MTTVGNVSLPAQTSVIGKTTRGLRSPGLLGKWPLIGLAMILVGSLTFGALAYNLATNGPLVQWDMTTALTLHRAALTIPASLAEYFIFGYFVGEEVILVLALTLGIYFLYKRFWRELTMVLVGLGGGTSIWYVLSRYFDRPRPGTQLDVILLKSPSFPSGPALSAVLCYGLLAYLLVPRMPSRFWKWVIGIFLTLVIVFVGFSRLILSGHYVTDVVAGYALGLAWAGLVYTLLERFFPGPTAQNQEYSLKKGTTEGLRVPGWFRMWPLLGLGLILIGSLSVAGLGYNLLAHGPLLQWDTSLYKDLITQAKTAPPIVNEIMIFGFFIGKQMVMVIVALLSIYFVYKRFWRELAMLLISSAAGSLIWNFFIAYFARPRPAEQTGLVVTSVPSFPSGHAMSAMICYGFLAYLLIPKMPSRFWKWTVAIAALLVILFDGFSRMFQGSHYLTDVLAGYALGMAWAGLVYLLIEGIFMQRKNQNVEKR